jgi:subtilisin family serine protease
MYKKIIILYLAAAVGVTACDNNEPATDPEVEDCITRASQIHGKVIPNRYIVSFENVDGSSSGRTAQTAANTFDRNKISGDNVIEVIEGEASHYVVNLSSEAAVALKQDASVLRVEPDRVLAIKACFSVEEPRLVTWNVESVGYGDGTGKTAWILDTGVDLDHPDLNVDQGRSRSFLAGGTSADDDNGHGTHISGIIGALNNNIGTLGVASGTSIAALKILDGDGEGLLSVALKALAHVRANGRAGDVANISMGLEDVSETLESEVRAVASKGIYVVIAAGNEGTQANRYSPARTSGPNIFTITAVDSLSHFAGFSNYGNDVVDFAAPGVRIPSTYINGKYAIMSGTSMAAPHVSGLLLINDGKVLTNGFALDDPDGTPDPIASKGD